MLNYGFQFYMILIRMGNIFCANISLQNILIFHRNMLNFLKSEPMYAYKRYAFKKRVFRVKIGNSQV